MRTLTVLDYQPAWADAFHTEARKLADSFGDDVVAIHHIGSTSVPGLRAKPIIDILLVLRDVTSADRFNDRMIALGYQPRVGEPTSRRSSSPTRPT